MPQILDIPIFRSLPLDVVASAGQSCVWRDYAPGELIVDFEDTTTDVRFILTGSIRVLIRIASGKEVILGELGPGDYFGEMAAIDGKGRSANVTALERSKVCLMPAGLFVDIVTGQKEIARAVLEDLVARIRHLNLLLTEQHFLTAAQRLYAELIRLSRQRKDAVTFADIENERIITPPPTQKDIAARIGSSREGISRELSALEKQGLVEKTKGGLVLKDVAGLSALISPVADEAE